MIETHCLTKRYRTLTCLNQRWKYFVEKMTGFVERMTIYIEKQTVVKYKILFAIGTLYILT